MPGQRLGDNSRGSGGKGSVHERATSLRGDAPSPHEAVQAIAEYGFVRCFRTWCEVKPAQKASVMPIDCGPEAAISVEIVVGQDLRQPSITNEVSKPGAVAGCDSERVDMSHDLRVGVERDEVVDIGRGYPAQHQAFRHKEDCAGQVV